MDTVHKFNDSCFSIQKPTNNIGTIWEIDSPNCFIRQKFSTRLCQLFQNIQNLFVHFHLLLESFKTTYRRRKASIGPTLCFFKYWAPVNSRESRSFSFSFRTFRVASSSSSVSRYSS